MIYVIDTSALMRLFIPDGQIPDPLEAALRGAERGDDALLAPELILAEAGQVLHKKRMQALLAPEEQNDILEGILSLPIRFFSHTELLATACDLAHSHQLTVYDALFLALAETHSAQVITADAELRQAADRMRL